MIDQVDGDAGPIVELKLSRRADPEPPCKPARRRLSGTLPRDMVEHATHCACPKCGVSLRPLGEYLIEVLNYVPGSFPSPGMCGGS